LKQIKIRRIKMSNKIVKDMLGLRKELGQKSLMAFAKTYFGHYCKLDFAPFQVELLAYLQGATLHRGRQLAVAAPRGNAKSSLVSLIYILWSICYKKEPCILIISNTKSQSKTLLSHIRDELGKNTELQRDFPEACGFPKRKWTSNEIITRNDVNVRISSATHGIRGIRHKEERPTLVILDDVESTESVRSQEAREKLHDWFSKDILNIGSEKTNYMVIGTILHFDSLLATLTSKDKEKFPGFERRVYKSVISWAANQTLWDKWTLIYYGKEFIDDKTGSDVALKFFEANEIAMLEGTKVLWPEKESYYGLMVIRAEKGNFSFASEKQNEPKDLSNLSLDMNQVDWWDENSQTKEDLMEQFANSLIVLGAVDPAISRSNRSDSTAIITAFVDSSENQIYVVGADIGKWDLGNIVKRVCMHHNIYNYSGFIYESNAAQKWLGDALIDEPNCPPLESVNNTQNKEARISKLILFIQQGKVKLSKRLTELNRQISNFPSGDHDDGIDALAMLVDMADDFSQAGPEVMEKVMGRMLGKKSGHQQISMIHPLSGETIYIDNPHGLFRI
jgi:predicted phage terminase large subunit-like protein